MDATYIIGELLTIATMAFAFSMDAFSLGLGIGMLHIRFKRMAAISVLTGFFHTVLPMFGIVIGKLLSVHFGDIAVLLGGCILIIIGLAMIRSAFQYEKRKSVILPYGFGVVLFPLTVSIDSISAGLSLGMFGSRVIVTMLLFGMISMMLTLSGLFLGRKFHHVFGGYSVAVGGVILLAFGMKMVIPYAT